MTEPGAAMPPGYAPGSTAECLGEVEKWQRKLAPPHTELVPLCDFCFRPMLVRHRTVHWNGGLGHAACAAKHRQLIEEPETVSRRAAA